MKRAELSKKNLLIILIYVELGLQFFAFTVLKKPGHNWVEYLSVFLALIYSFAVYIAVLFNDKDKIIIYYYCAATVVVSVFLLLDMGYLKYADFGYRYVQIIVLFIILDLTLQILTQNISKRLFYKYIILALWTIGVILLFLKQEIYLLIYQVTFFIISIYPIGFLIYNYKRIKNYGKHLIPILLIVIFLNIVFLSQDFFISKKYSGSYNYDLYIYLNLIEFFLSYLIFSALGFWKLLKNNKYRINVNTFIMAAFVAAYLYYGRENLILSFFSVFSFAVIIKQCQLLDYFIKLKYEHTGDSKEVSEVFKDMVEKNMSDFRKEELYKEQLADFLHDEILQEAIFIKKELHDGYGISANDKISIIADKLIDKIRGQMTLYKPYINYEITLSENYFNLIKQLQSKFGNYGILVDFVCNYDFFLSPPYDLVVYRILHELVTNIYKHSEGRFSTVELEVRGKIIYINVTNYGDYLKNGYMESMDSRGLKIIKRELDRFDGTLDMRMTGESSTSNQKGTYDNCEVNINITIPIRGDITYEHFINS